MESARRRNRTRLWALLRIPSPSGQQHDSLAVGDAERVIQRAHADRRGIFQSTDGKESDCLAALLRILDLLVEEGWAGTRQLTLRLEEIYRWLKCVPPTRVGARLSSSS